MRWYIGFDDTDTLHSELGTGKYARYFARNLEPEFSVWGVVRQQLPQLPDIPFTTHNSSACVVVDTKSPSARDDLIQAATGHIHRYFQEGSDPGLCIACEADGAPALESFGRLCSAEIVTQKQAYTAGATIHLSGHGGTNDGVIGALAAVGLTMSGWGGSFIQFADIRSLPARISIRDLRQRGIEPVAASRKGLLPTDGQELICPRGIRPRLWAGRPVLPLVQNGNLDWEPIEGNEKDMEAKK